MISYSHEGLTGSVKRAKHFVQDHIILAPWPIKNVQFLSTTGKQITLIKKEKLLELADEAQKWESNSLFLMMAGLAIAMMTIALGDWTVNEEKF